jgi:tetratricopeptide (TPR) repeat protein
MLARDEAARLPAVAERVGLIGAVTILLDDRTADDTAAVAERLWGGLPGGGEVVPFSFDDFGQARNLLLETARASCDPDDYLLLLDPDSLPDGDLPEHLDLDAYSCTWRWAGEEWPRVILLRAGADASYEGAVHEVLSVRGSVGHLPAVTVDAVVTAGPERLVMIEGILRRDADTSPRSAFYLAQTLNDLGRTDEAFGWYMRRAAMGYGWVEETWFATYLAGCLIERLDWKFAVELWQRAYAMRPGRAEPLYQLARAANVRGDYSEALSWASLGLRVGPSSDTLRVNRWIEQEGLSDEFNRAAIGLTGAQTPRVEIAHG